MCLGERHIVIRSERKIENHISLEKITMEPGVDRLTVMMRDQEHIVLVPLLSKIETMCPECREENEKGIKIMILDNGAIIYECKRCNKLIWTSSLLSQIDSGYQREYDINSERIKRKFCKGNYEKRKRNL